MKISMRKRLRIAYMLFKELGDEKRDTAVTVVHESGYVNIVSGGFPIKDMTGTIANLELHDRVRFAQVFFGSLRKDMDFLRVDVCRTDGGYLIIVDPDWIDDAEMLKSIRNMEIKA